MRVLFSGTPAFGHLLPMLPLAQAAQQAGHEVAFLTHAVMTQPLQPFQVLPSGPDVGSMIAEVTRRTGGNDPFTDTVPALTAELLAEVARRTGSGSPAPETGPSMNAELFAGTRVDLSIDEALPAARGYAPDLVVAEGSDYVGPLVAAALTVPWIKHGIILSGIMGGAVGRAMDAAVASRYAARNLTPSPPLAVLDIFPELLQLPGWKPDADALTLRPQPHTLEGVAWTAPSFPGREDRPTVLLTLGTVFDNPTLLTSLLSALGTVEVNVVVTLGSQEKADAFEADLARVFPVGFVPLDQLLQGVDLVISAGGAGTVLAALSRGLPLVIFPLIADQPVNAGRVAASGAGVVVTSPKEVGATVQEVLANPGYHASAQKVAEQISQMNTPERVLDILVERMTAHKS